MDLMTKCLRRRDSALSVDKLLHQPLRLVGEKRAAEHANADVYSVCEREFLPLARQVFLGAQRLRSAFEQRLDQAFDCGIKTAFWRDNVDESPGKCSRGIDILGRHHQPAGTSGANQARQQRGMNDAWNPDADLRHPKFGVRCRNTEVAGGRNLKSAAQTPSRHARNDGRGKVSHGLAEIAQAGDEFLGGLLVEADHLLDVGSADHALWAFAGEHENPDLRVRGERIEALVDGLDDPRPQNIKRASIANCQTHDTTWITIDAAVGIQHLHKALVSQSERISVPRQKPILSRLGVRWSSHCCSAAHAKYDGCPETKLIDRTKRDAVSAGKC